MAHACTLHFSRFRMWTAALCLLLTVAVAPGRAHADGGAAAAAAAAATAGPVLTPAGELVRDIAAIPLSVADIVKLPMGVVECVFAPLPGIEFMSGLRHIGTGLLGPFRLVIATLSIPADIGNTMVGTGKALSGQK